MRFSFVMLAVLLAGCATILAAPQKASKDAVAKVELERYLGTWYVIALDPSGDERGQVAMSVDYTRGSGNSIEATWSSRDEDFSHPLGRQTGTATVLDPDSSALWSVKFPWNSAALYEILYVDAEYRYTIAADSNRRLAQLLAREQRVSDETYDSLVGVLKTKGYDVSQLVRVPQVEDQLGAPGYSP